MKLRLHEIEFGSSNVKEASDFYRKVFGLPSAVLQEGLSVFNAGVGLDLNVSNHFPQGVVAISFLTDDLSELERRLKEAGIPYEGPSPSHLGMTCIEMKSPDGYFIKVNSAGPESPAWLQV
jgi:catechol 2,3-dioxygenase-like lactoylglutathione lyase family enzyme